MDHASEQEMEVEALQSILMDDITVLEGGTRPGGWPPEATCYCVSVTPEAEGEEEADDFAERLELVFAHTPAYPEEPPLLRLRNVRGLGDADLAKLQALLDGLVQQSLGAPMIYDLVAASQEWLRERVATQGGGAEAELDPMEAAKAAAEAEEKRLAELRAHGTPVNPTTFAAWKAQYDAKMAALREAGEADGEKNRHKGGPTGKQYFQSQDRAGVVVSEEAGEGESEEEEGEDESYDPRHRGSGSKEGDSEDETEDLEDDDDDEDFLDDYLAKKP